MSDSNVCPSCYGSLEGLSTSQGPLYRCKSCQRMWREEELYSPDSMGEPQTGVKIQEGSPSSTVDAVISVLEALRPLSVADRRDVLNKVRDRIEL